MLVYVEQDIFKSPAQVLVNTVNTVGVMGKGIAKRYKEVYPEMYSQYRELCESNLLQIGKLWLYKTETKWVLNFPTKKHWRNPSKLEYIESGLKKFVSTYEEKKITSISFPQLGVGNGGLDWEKQVKPLMEKYLKGLPIDVFIHLYDQKNSNIEHLDIENTIQWIHQNPRNLSINQVWDDLVSLVNSHSYGFQEDGWQVQMIDLSANSNEDASPQFDFDNQYLNYFSLTHDGYNIAVTQGALLDMWVKLRDYGYLVSYDFPSEFQKNNDFKIVSELLANLSYIDRIRLERTNGAEEIALTINNKNLPIARGTSNGEVNAWIN